MLDPILVAQLSNLHLKARRILDGLYSGHHVNLNRGASQEFSEHRPYNLGDDLKRIDWKIFGRTDRLVIKQYEEETNVSGIMVVDDSASMNFSSANHPSKLEYSKMMAAAMGYLLVSQHDAVGLSTSSQNLPAARGKGHLDHYFEILESMKANGSWKVNSLMDAMSQGFLKKRGFLVLFSDLMQEPEEYISTLRALNTMKHEILVFQVLDPAEIELPYEGPLLIEDSETREILRTDADALKQVYSKMVRERLAATANHFRRSGIDYCLLTTNTSFDKGMGAYLSWRDQA